jgi:hypothetical protein
LSTSSFGPIRWPIDYFSRHRAAIGRQEAQGAAATPTDKSVGHGDWLDIDRGLIQSLRPFPADCPRKWRRVRAFRA